MNPFHRLVTRRTAVTASALIVVSGVALLIAGYGFGGHKAQPVVASATPAQLVEIRSVALETAARNGDPRPTGGEVLATTKKAVLALNDGPEPIDNPNVYVVTLHGNFVAISASVPHGTAIPAGDEMILLFNARTLEPAGFMLGSTPLDLTQLGNPQQLNLAG